MSSLKRSIIKQTFLNIITNFFKPIGYNPFISGEDPCFVFADKEITISFFFNFFSDNSIACSPIRLTHYLVENYILDIGFPGNRLEKYKNKERYHLPTLELRNFPIELDSRSLLSKTEVEEFAQEFINFFKDKIIEEIEKYKNLNQVLIEMDELRSKGKYWKEILSGGPEHLIRGLIIAKICDDTAFVSKMQWVEELISGLDDWGPYWEKYKTSIVNIKPRI